MRSLEDELAKREEERQDDQRGMTSYTRWWLAHPWHVTQGMAVPPDCDCEFCVEKREKQEEEKGDSKC